MTETIAELDWLELLPDGAAPAGYGELLRAERAMTARHDEVAARVAELDRIVRDGAADLDLDPTKLIAVAGDLAALRQVQAVLPPVPVVPNEVHEDVATIVAATMAGGLSLGGPPMLAAEIVHTRQHKNPAPVIALPEEVELNKMFEQACAENEVICATVRLLSEPLNGRPLALRVRQITEFRDGPLAAHLLLVQNVQKTVQLINANRMKEGRAHRCPVWGGAYVALDEVRPGAGWTLEAQIAGNGRPPHAVGDAMLAVA